MVYFSSTFTYFTQINTLLERLGRGGAAQVGLPVNNMSIYVYIICMFGNTNYPSNLRVVMDYSFHSRTSYNNVWYIFWALRCCDTTI